MKFRLWPKKDVKKHKHDGWGYLSKRSGSDYGEKSRKVHYWVNYSPGNEGALAAKCGAFFPHPIKQYGVIFDANNRDKCAGCRDALATGQKETS